MIRRWFTVLILFLSYIITWFAFGEYYYRQAKETNGKAFLFQQDLLFDQKLSAFSQRVGFKVPQGIFHELLAKDKESIFREIKYNAKHWSVHNSNIDKRKKYPISLQGQIGETWSNYYLYKYLCMGARYFTFAVSDRPNQQLSPTKGPIWWVTLYDFQSNPMLNFQIYRNAQLKELLSQYALESGNYSIELLPTLIESSLNYPDHDYNIFVDIQDGNYEYAINDFLYFSAVTITTLGYGDILPNNANIRFWVMVESFSGVTLLGLFISSFFINWPRKLKSKRLPLPTRYHLPIK